MSLSVSGVSSYDYTSSILKATTATSAVSSTASTEKAEDPTVESVASVSDQFKALEKQKGLESFLSSSAGAAVLAAQSGIETDSSGGYAAGMIDKVLAEYKKNASDAESTPDTSTVATTA